MCGRLTKVAALLGTGVLFQAGGCGVGTETLVTTFLQAFLGLLVSSAVNGFFNVSTGFGF